MRPKKIIQLRDYYNFYFSAIFVIRNTVAKIRKYAIQRSLFDFCQMLKSQSYLNFLNRTARKGPEE